MNYLSRSTLLISGLATSATTVGICTGLYFKGNISFISLLALLIISIYGLIKNPSRLLQRLSYEKILICSLLLFTTGYILSGINNSIIPEETSRLTVLLLLIIGLRGLSKIELKTILTGHAIGAIISLVFLIIITRFDIVSFIISNKIHRNLIGLSMIAISWTLGYMASNRAQKFASSIIIIICIIISYKAGSRGGMVFSLLSIVSIFIPLKGIEIKNGILKSIYLIVPSIILFIIFKQEINDALLINDEHRGISSGGSGRLDSLLETKSILTDYFLAGAGSGNAELARGGPLDNAYFACYLELGIWGLAGYILFLISSCKQEIIESNVSRKILFIITYCLYGLVEGRYITLGNPISPLLFLVASDHITLKARKNANNLQRNQ